MTPARRTEELYEEQLQHLFRQMSMPFRTRGTPVILPFSVPGEDVMVRSTDPPPPESLKPVDPALRVLYEPLGYPPSEPRDAALGAPEGPEP